MIKLCIFDLDGTLVNSLNDLAGAMNFALENNGYPPHEPEKYRRMVGSGISVLADRAMNAFPPPENKKQAVLRDFKEYYESHCLDSTVPYQGIDGLLDRLEKNGILFAVNSNKPDEFAGLIVRRLFPGHSFACVVGKREGFERKPSPDGVREIMRVTGTDASQCIYIGDSDIDVFTAANSGIRFCGVSWGFRGAEELKKAGADFVVSSPSELFGHIASLS